MTLPSDTKIEGITKAELILMVNEAAEHGATKALARLGLHDENAVHDIKEIRDLLDGWRATRKSIWSVVVRAVTIAILGFIAVATWSEFRDRL